jgi:hypothetical protein
MKLKQQIATLCAAIFSLMTPQYAPISVIGEEIGIFVILIPGLTFITLLVLVKYFQRQTIQRSICNSIFLITFVASVHHIIIGGALSDDSDSNLLLGILGASISVFGIVKRT